MAPLERDAIAESGTPLLELSDFSLARGSKLVLDGVSFTLKAGETMALVGESGAGKSTIAMAAMGLLQAPEARLSGRIAFQGGDNLANAPESAWTALRGRRIAMIFQDAGAALNPCFSIGDQLMSPLIRLIGLSRQEARIKALELLHNAGVNDPEQRLSAFPHQLSGGMQQRVMIAMALASDPELLLADEPTSALDVTIQAQIINIILEQTKKRSAACIFVLHDLALASQACDSIAVLYAGQVAEYGPCAAVLKNPRHPYTRLLLSCVLDIDTTDLHPPSGGAPALSGMPAGCRFAPRCPNAQERCHQTRPTAQSVEGRTLFCWNP